MAVAIPFRIGSIPLGQNKSKFDHYIKKLYKSFELITINRQMLESSVAMTVFISSLTNMEYLKLLKLLLNAKT